MKPLLPYEEPPFSPFDRVALAQLIYRVARPGCRIAEIGSWTGLGSTKTILERLTTVPDAKLICIDTWKGNNSCDYHRVRSEEYDLFATFRANVTAALATKMLVPIVADSVDAARLIADHSFDLVFIDADHSYEFVKKDIEAWLPKVRPGGIICGHDCEERVTEQNRRLLEGSKTVDAIEAGPGKKFLHFHCGVILAVDQVFSGKASLFAESQIILSGSTPGYSSIWYVNLPQPRRGILHRWMSMD